MIFFLCNMRIFGVLVGVMMMQLGVAQQVRILPDTMHTLANLQDAETQAHKVLQLRNTFTIHNPGNDTLVIHRIAANLPGTVVVSPSPKQVLPGDSVAIPVQFRVATYAPDGWVHRSFIISTNQGKLRCHWAIEVQEFKAYPMTDEDVQQALKQLPQGYWMNHFAFDTDYLKIGEPSDTGLVVLKPGSTPELSGRTAISFRGRKMFLLQNNGVHSSRTRVGTSTWKGNTLMARFKKPYHITVFYQIIDVQSASQVITARCWIVPQTVGDANARDNGLRVR